MVSYSTAMLKVFTQVLRQRVARIRTLDLNILEPDSPAVIQYPRGHLGRFVGYFHVNPGGKLLFVMFGREDPNEPEPSMVFILYPRDMERLIPESELGLFVGRTRRDIHTVKVNIRTQYGPEFDHSPEGFRSRRTLTEM